MRNAKVQIKKMSIDENLFGTPNHVIERKKILEKKWQKNNNSTKDCAEIISTVHRLTQSNPNADMVFSKDPRIFCPEVKEKVRIVSQDLLRDLRIPNEKIKPKSLLLKSNDFYRLKAKAKVLTDEEMEKLEEREKKQKEDKMIESRERRNFIQTMDLKRRRNEKLSDLEEEAYRQAQYLLEKAMQQREEQEPEIKMMNNLAKNAQIQAIRDAQILEKQQISKELLDEDRRLDNMMEIERTNQIAIQEEIDRKRLEEEKLGAYQILKQIENNEEERLLQLELKDRENQEYQRQFVEQMEAEYLHRVNEDTKKHQIRRELDKANTELLSRRHCDKERDIMLTQRVLQIQQEKAAREEAYEQEQIHIKKEKELECARLRALQEKFQDEKAERDALKAKRAIEDAEREWRRKEAEEAQKKIDTEIMLKAARAEQLRDQERKITQQAAKDREDFDRMLKAQKEAIEKEQADIERKFGRAQQYKDDIKKQIREKERQLIVDRHEYFLEGIKLQEEARLRRLRLNNAKERKFRELRKAGIPEVYLAQLERKLQTMENNKIAD